MYLLCIRGWAGILEYVWCWGSIWFGFSGFQFCDGGSFHSSSGHSSVSHILPSKSEMGWWLGKVEEWIGSQGITLLSVICNHCCWQLWVVHLVQLTSARITPVYTREAFSLPHPLLIPHFPSFPLGFPSSPDQNNVFYHPVLINVPYSVWVPHLWVCALIRLGVHSQITGSGFSLGYLGTLVTEWSTLPILDREGDPSPHRVPSWICLSVDLNGGLILEYSISWLRIPQTDMHSVHSLLLSSKK